MSIVRVSGPRARPTAEALTRRPLEPRAARLAALRTSGTGELIDRGVVLYFPGPASFTGEDVVEFQVHGSRAIVAAMYRALSTFEECRPAKPGEFTRRAFENGKMDLTMAEGLADLLNAETDLQRRQAHTMMEGGIRDQAEQWRRGIISILAQIEARIDFAEEDDVANTENPDMSRSLSELTNSMDAVLATGDRGASIRDGASVVILGPPNAGKSSLLNALAARDVAIVTPIAGTTRDPIEAQIDIHGIPVTLVDTAGLRESADQIESEGVSRALRRAAAARLVIWISDNDERIPAGVVGDDMAVLTVRSKVDLSPPETNPSAEFIPISSRTGQGLDTLLRRISETILDDAKIFEPALVSRSRQLGQIRRARSILDGIAKSTGRPELAAIDLKAAVAAIDNLIGSIDNETVLDEVFSSFCIGK